MNVKKIDHIAINVMDYKKSIKFYSDILGLEKQETVDFEDFSITYYKLPDGTRLELFEGKNINKKNDNDENSIGLRHIAFKIEDVASQEKKLREHMVKIILPTTEISELGKRVLLFLDPNGVTIEFCEDI